MITCSLFPLLELPFFSSLIPHYKIEFVEALPKSLNIFGNIFQRAYDFWLKKNLYRYDKIPSHKADLNVPKPLLIMKFDMNLWEGFLQSPKEFQLH